MYLVVVSHVVGVINKIEGGEEETDDMDFAQFKYFFRDTKEYERRRFEKNFRNKYLPPLSITTQCTTSAVFNKMEQISFSMV